MDCVGRSVIKKIELNFREQAKDEKARRIIAEEVVKFINNSQGAEEEDVLLLEDQIRHRLAGNGSTGKSEKMSAKQARMKADDWSKVCLYMSYLAKEEEKQKRLEAKSQVAQHREALEAQLVEASQRTKEEVAKKKLELSMQDKDMAQWQNSQKQRIQENQNKIEKLKEDRKVQLEDQLRRKEIVSALKKKSEEDTTVRIAMEVKRQLEADAAAKAKAKQELKSLLLANEENERVKQELRQKQFQADIRYMKEYSDNLEKQEQERLAQLERIKAVQARQAEDAKTRPPVKKWVDPAVIEKQFQEKQAALAADEARRKAAMAERSRKFKADVAAQLAEKERHKLEQLEIQRKELMQSMKELELSKEMEKKEKDKELEKVRAFKADLDKQINDNRVNRAKNSMSETERLLNSKLMEQMNAYI